MNNKIDINEIWKTLGVFSTKFRDDELNLAEGVDPKEFAKELALKAQEFFDLAKEGIDEGLAAKTDEERGQILAACTEASQLGKNLLNLILALGEKYRVELPELRGEV